ncbi:MAG: hypothetical protein RIB65_19070 [Ilumatobacter fluminis]|uniref:hypothetical protein n=1 Tax=Ilumatobacter fluminis TaxID=467091 RepID=UPI0032EF7D92
MSAGPAPAGSDPPIDERIIRLEERLDRERKARRQAEMIAERGMRDLWEINRELQERVDDRTAQVGRLLAGYERARSAWSDVMTDELERARSTVLAGGDVDEAFALVKALAAFARRQFVDEAFSERPARVAADILQRWQRPTARHGQLLTTDADTTDAEVCTRWDCVIALCEVAIASIVHACESGVVAVRFTVDRPHLAVTIEHPPATDDIGRAALAVAARIIRRATDDADGTCRWDDGRVDATLPITG